MFKFIHDINFHRKLNIPAPPVRMSLQSSLFTFSFTTPCSSSSHETSTPTITPFLNPVTRQSNQPDSSGRSEENNGELLRASSRSCMCGRRHFLEAASTALFPICPSIASDNLQPRYKVCLPILIFSKSIHYRMVITEISWMPIHSQLCFICIQSCNVERLTSQMKILNSANSKMYHTLRIQLYCQTACNVCQIEAEINHCKNVTDCVGSPTPN